ncbi:Hpt domain-containing protein [Pseudarthrobacter phenanthrenivorans]|uniref:Hpt domain-containing protein n=1 Tax=Pseudarthrobacter phenanthrenivorans TaxID=361575 RepID=UPI00112839BD|nr:Hpt domain-containing protein [Pseudarthrobacter phenanthrenivorans]TPV48227.1 Hpt domain-containing protein [Pseudarthrobacter phenanthrenivorans]
MTQPDGYARPLLDPAVLERLRDELENDESVWKVFVEDFIAQLPQRLQRVRLTLTTGDAKGAMDAILSLKTSSQMVGAERLAGLASDLEQSLRQEAGTTDPAVALPLLAANHLRRIKQCAQRTINVLQNHLQQGP